MGDATTVSGAKILRGFHIQTQKLVTAFQSDVTIVKKLHKKAVAIDVEMNDMPRWEGCKDAGSESNRGAAEVDKKLFTEVNITDTKSYHPATFRRIPPLIQPNQMAKLAHVQLAIQLCTPANMFFIWFGCDGQGLHLKVAGQ